MGTDGMRMGMGHQDGASGWGLRTRDGLEGEEKIGADWN
jgi:hypothetical protein